MANDQLDHNGEEPADVYGRREGCFVDYESAPFRFKDVAQSLDSTQLNPSRKGFAGLINEPGLHIRSFPKPHIDLEESFASADIEGQLDVATGNGVRPDAVPSVFSRTSHLRHLQLPLELPELASDPVQDLNEYFREINEKRFGDPFSQWLPLSPTKGEDDEGLGFPPTPARMHSLLLRELDCETIEISQEAADLKMEIHDLVSTEGPKTTCEFSKRNPRWVEAEPVTPPLSPMSTDSHCSPYKPDPKICIIDLTSEPSSPVPPEVTRLEKSIRNGRIESEPPACEAIGPTPSTPVLPTYAKKSTVSLKELEVDVPLASNASSSDNTSNKDALKRPGLLDNLADSEPLSDDKLVESFFDEAFTSTLEAHQSDVMMAIEQERFDPVDSIARIPVPALDFTLDAPEWMEHMTDGRTQFLWVLSHHIESEAFSPIPRSTAAAAEKRLKWAPFAPGTGRASTIEELGPLPDQAKELLILEPAPELSSESYVKRAVGLFVERLEEEDEFEAGDEDYQAPGGDGYFQSTHFSTSDVGKAQEEPKDMTLDSLLSAAANKRRRTQTQQDAASMLPRGSDADASNKLLAGFMEMRAVKRPKVTAGTTLTSIPSAYLHAPLSRSADKGTSSSPPPAPPGESASLTPAPAPESIMPLEKACFVISLDIPRTILRSIESSWPKDHLIDRDYSYHDDFVWSPGSTQRKPVTSIPAFDADIALTPTVGIVITTLQKAKQMQLPKSKELPQLRKRVLEVSSKYETLYILVSESSPAGEYTSPLHPSDAAAYADFVEFTVSLQAGVTACFVPGADKTMAKWILSLMCRYSPHGLSSKPYLNAVESTWEVFFRRAGMKTFAAQVLAGAVLEKGGEEGLARLMASSPAEIIATFGPFIGGEKGLASLSKILCTPWA